MFGRQSLEGTRPHLSALLGRPLRRALPQRARGLGSAPRNADSTIVVTDATPLATKSGRVLLWVSGAAGVLWAIALVAAAGYLLLRPDCPDGWVRFLDLGPLPVAVSAVGLAGTVVLLVLGRRPGRHRTLALVACLSLVLGSLFAAAALTTAVHTVVNGADPACWTF